jgi:HAD superfamily hydrolase (TIGR01509 family)
MLKALLFDLDGTLSETDTLHYIIWHKMLKPYQLEIDQDFYQKKISGRLNPDIVQDLLPQLSPEEQAAFIEQKEARFREEAALRPLAGLISFLDWAKEQQLQRAVVSNAPRKNAEFMLATLGVEAVFSTVILSDDLPSGKPHPLPYQEALRRLEVSAEEAIAFEDSPSGIQSAVGAGVAVVGIASTHDPKRLEAQGAAIVVQDFADPRLMQWLEQRFQLSPDQRPFSSSGNAFQVVEQSAP